MRIHPPETLLCSSVAAILSALSLAVYLRISNIHAAWISIGFGVIAILIPLGTWLWSWIFQSVEHHSK
jgi:hypothetical protein